MRLLRFAILLAIIVGPSTGCALFPKDTADMDDLPPVDVQMGDAEDQSKPRNFSRAGEPYFFNQRARDIERRLGYY